MSFKPAIKKLDYYESGIDIATADARYLKLDQTTQQTTVANFSFPSIRAYYPVEFTGTGTVGASGTTVTGVGTKFLTECKVGWKIRIFGNMSFVNVIASISSDTSLTTATTMGSISTGRAVFFTAAPYDFWSSSSNRIAFFDIINNMHKFYGTMVFASYTSGLVPYFTGGGQVAQNTNFTYDGTNLAIGGAITLGNTYGDYGYNALWYRYDQKAMKYNSEGTAFRMVGSPNI